MKEIWNEQENRAVRRVVVTEVEPVPILSGRKAQEPLVVERVTVTVWWISGREDEGLHQVELHGRLKMASGELRKSINKFYVYQLKEIPGWLTKIIDRATVSATDQQAVAQIIRRATMPTLSGPSDAEVAERVIEYLEGQGWARPEYVRAIVAAAGGRVTIVDDRPPVTLKMWRNVVTGELTLWTEKQQ